jgi:glycerol-3-phosphate dehydrogenase
VIPSWGGMETQVLVIGGGATGTALARDLSLRGLSCLLVEREDLNAGASGRNHGLLHSGARYAATDPAAAIECREEGALLKRMAPQCIQDTGGLFVAVAGDDERFVADFPAACARAGIEARPVPVAEAREMEPSLSERTIAAFAVPDASVDPFDLSLQQMAHAQSLGAALLRRTAVRSFERSGGRLRAARAIREETGEELRIEAQMVVNATGAWAGEVARLCGADVPMLHSKGTLLVTHARLAHRVVNRCRRPSDADIVMPGGTVSIVGTTSVAVRDLADVRPTVAEVDRIVEEASAMMPALATARYIRAYAGVRPRGEPRLHARRPRAGRHREPAHHHGRQAHHLSAHGRTHRRPGLRAARRRRPLPDARRAPAGRAGPRLDRARPRGPLLDGRSPRWRPAPVRV